MDTAIPLFYTTPHPRTCIANTRANQHEEQGQIYAICWLGVKRCRSATLGMRAKQRQRSVKALAVREWTKVPRGGRQKPGQGSSWCAAEIGVARPGTEGKVLLALQPGAPLAA